MLAAMAGDRDEFVEDPAFILLGCLLVCVPDPGPEFLFRHLADFSTAEAASRLFGDMLI